MFNKIDKKTLVLAGVLFVALILSTWLLRIDIPYTNALDAEKPISAGYITLGDIIIYISAMLLAGPVAAVVCAFGGMFADLFAGHASYAIASFIIKGAAAFGASLLLKRSDAFMKKVKAIIFSGLFMVLCYFLYDFIIRSNYYIAAIALPLRILQLIACGAVAALVLFFYSGKAYKDEQESPFPPSDNTTKRNLR